MLPASPLRTSLVRGLKAGAIAGVAFALFLALVGNPLIGFAEEVGHGDHAGADETHEESAVPHAVTELVSVAGGLLWGLLLGAVFGIAFYFLEPALPGGGAIRSYALAAAGFVTLSGAPWLVLPPQIPGAEQVLAVETRLFWYGTTMFAGAAACGLAGYAYRRLSTLRSNRVAVVGALVPLAVLPLIALLAPANPATSDVPATVAAAYRGHVVVGQLALWGVLATAYAWFRESGDDATRAGFDGEDPAYPAD